MKTDDYFCGLPGLVSWQTHMDAHSLQGAVHVAVDGKAVNLAFMELPIQ